MKRLCLYPIGLLMFLLLLNACSPGETPPQEDDPKEQGSIPLDISLEQMSLQDLNDEPVRTAISRLSSMGGTTISKNMGSDLYGFTVDTSMVKVITHDDVTSYTFPIKRDRNDGSFFENLVLQRNPSGNLQAFLVRYHLKDGIRALAEHSSFSFEGRRELFSLDLERLDVGIVEKNDTCYDVVELWCHFGGTDHPAGEMCILEAQLTGDDRLFYKESIICLSWGSGSGIPEGPDPGIGEGGNGGGAGFEDPYIITAPTNVALYEFQLKEFASGKLSQAERGYYNSDPNIKNIVDGYLIDNGISNLAMFKAKNHLSLGNDLSLTPQQFVWYFQHRDSGEVEDLKQYLQDQSNSAKARAFGKESIRAWMDNGEVDFEEEIIYDAELLDCQKAILQDLKNTPESRISEILNDFSGETQGSRDYGWRVKTAYLGSGKENAKTTFFLTIAETKINNDRMKDATDLMLAATFIHEAIHAWLGFHFNDDPNSVYEEYEVYYNQYISQQATPNNIGHDVMADILRSKISNALKAYGESKGYALDDFVYEALAWSGLTEKEGPNNINNIHPKFVEYVPNPEVRSKILNILHAETHNQIGFGNAMPQGQQACN